MFSFTLAFTIFFLLIGAQFLADYCIQGDAVATGKNKKLDSAKFGVPWYYWMCGHAFTQGLLVAIITQNAFIGLLETVFHFFVDWMKCEGKIGIHTDQWLHFGSKIVWVALYFALSIDKAYVAAQGALQ